MGTETSAHKFIVVDMGGRAGRYGIAMIQRRSEQGRSDRYIISRCSQHPAGECVVEEATLSAARRTARRLANDPSVDVRPWHFRRLNKEHPDARIYRKAKGHWTGVNAYGYGRKIVTDYVVRYGGRTRRVYCACYSNSGTFYVLEKGEWLVVDEFDTPVPEYDRATVRAHELLDRLPTA